jgi:hypothetical protein
VGRVLKLAPTRLDPRKTLGSMGLSSLLAIELRNHLETVIGRPLLASLAWNYPTIEAIVGHLLDVALGMVPGADPSASGPDVATALPPGFADVATMSEEAALLALLQRPADVAQ